MKLTYKRSSKKNTTNVFLNKELIGEIIKVEKVNEKYGAYKYYDFVSIENKLVSIRPIYSQTKLKDVKSEINAGVAISSLPIDQEILASGISNRRIAYLLG